MRTKNLFKQNRNNEDNDDDKCICIWSHTKLNQQMNIHPIGWHCGKKTSTFERSLVRVIEHNFCTPIVLDCQFVYCHRHMASEFK